MAKLTLHSNSIVLRGRMIRIAKKDDLEGIMAIFKSWPKSYDYESAQSYYKNFFDGKHDADVVFVLEKEDEIVGTAGYCLEQSEGVKGIYWLNWLYISQEHQGKGYASNLLSFVIKELKAKNARKLFVNTSSHKFYKNAVRLYVKFGFEEEGCLEKFYSESEHQIIFGLDFKMIQKIPFDSSLSA